MKRLKRVFLTSCSPAIGRNHQPHFRPPVMDDGGPSQIRLPVYTPGFVHWPEYGTIFIYGIAISIIEICTTIYLTSYVFLLFYSDIQY